MSLKLATWNINSAPTMLNRKTTFQSVKGVIENKLKSCDLILLQEICKYKVGVISSSLDGLFKPLLNKFPHLQRLSEYIMIFESKFFFSKVIDDTKALVDFARKQGFTYSFSANKSAKHINSGLLVLSKHPLETRRGINFEKDAVHSPGALSFGVTKGAKLYSIVNLHLIPSLSEGKLSYFCCNLVNKLLGRNTRLMRERALNQVGDCFVGENTVVAGDYNIDRGGDEYFNISKALGLCDSGADEILTFKMTGFEKQLDYVFVSYSLKVKILGALDVSCSDHDPLLIILD